MMELAIIVIVDLTHDVIDLGSNLVWLMDMHGGYKYIIIFTKVFMVWPTIIL